MARGNPGPKPVEATEHIAKRTSIPTADAQELIDPEMTEARRIRMEHRLPTPELLRRGKDDADLDVEAPPIYIQEKVDPRVLVENLRKTAGSGQIKPELTLFDTFDGLHELDSVDFYRHQANWSNRVILGDSLQVINDYGDEVMKVYDGDPPHHSYA